jgi:ADP-ribosyl-[dinitrogen reductase] hydrolase
MLQRLEDLGALTARELDPQELGSPDWAVPSSAAFLVPVAVALGARSQTFEDAVTLAVRCGGDTDTVAAMAGAIAGARLGATSIPARWRSALEEGPRGRRFVERLAASLTEDIASS